MRDSLACAPSRGSTGRTAGPARDVRQAALRDADGVLHLLRGVEDVHCAATWSRPISVVNATPRSGRAAGQAVAAGWTAGGIARSVDDALIAGRGPCSCGCVRRFFYDNSGCPERDALRRGHVYGSVVVDMATGRPVDLLPDREMTTFAAWLQEHPGVEVICRDRAGAYAEAARLGAPDAVQVADRWHMWHNLAGHLERSVLAHRRCLRELPHPDQPAPAAAQQDTTAENAEDTVAPVRELRIVTRTRERYQAITALHADGASIAAIARTLGVDRHTVRRFVRASSLEELQAKTLQRASLLDGYTDYLHQRWTQGCTDAAALTKEITALGYRGSDSCCAPPTPP